MVIDFWRSFAAKLEGLPQVNYVPIGRCMDEIGSTKDLARVWTEN
jgi:hypothetical protein